MAIQSMNLALRFFLELCVLAAVFYWGIVTGKGLPVKLILGVGSSFVIAFVWGIFGSPKASIPLHGLLHLLLETIVFGAGVLALYAAGRHQLAIIFGIIIIVNRMLMYIWHQ